jgi:alkane 1-monooxygenase
MHTASTRWLDLRFLLGLALPALTLYNVTHDPRHAAWGAFLTWAFIATAEAAWPALARSPLPAGPRPALGWLLRLHAPVQLVLLAAGLAVAARADWPTVIGMGYAVGFVTGAQGITFAHELGHGRRRADRALAWLLMTSVNYPQFMVEHYRGHHVRAATRADPASARRGESLWRFLPRTVVGSTLDAWKLERERLAQHRERWHRSPLLWASAANAGFVLALAAAGQGRMLVFWLVQSAFAVWLLEAVNYIEHYGLQRRIRPDGRPERFALQHAWNADHLVSNSMLANLQRHSDHHLHAWKRYPELQARPGPQLPTGYAGCLLLAALPPLWFALMHPRLERLLSNGASSTTQVGG